MQQQPVSGLGLMIVACLSVDILRQKHMKYKADTLIAIQKFQESQGFDPRSFPVSDKVSVLENLHISLFLSDF